MVLNTEWSQVEVIDLINDGSGLAFGIIGGRSTGVVVKTILPGGVADRDGRLQSGDHILQIGEVNLRGLGSEQVASVLRQCGVHVRMVVARPVESSNADYQTLNSQAAIVPTKILGDPVELDRHLIENGYAESISQLHPVFSTPYICTTQQSDLQLHAISGVIDVVKNPLPIGNVPSLPPLISVPTTMLPLDMALHEPNLPETEIYTVELRKDDLGLGITVAGYVCEKEEISGIFVKSVSAGSASALTGKIKVNDRIVEVDGKSVRGQTNHQAVEILRNTGPLVTIKFERYLRGPKFEQLQQAIRANELRPPSPSSPSASSLPKIPLSLVQMSYLGVEPEGDSRTSIDFDSAVLLDNETSVNEDQEIVIGGRKSVQFSISSKESIYDKWRDEYGDAEIVIAEMHKEVVSGLGISLEGTVDVEDGREVRPHHYIRNILPEGPVGHNGVLQSGDELLEVNGIQLKGMNHLEVVSILKQLPNFVCLVCARYPIPTRVIDTSQHREAFQARKILADSLQTLISSPTIERLVKAKSETSIASSVVSETTCTGSRSRSLELITGLPMWNEQHTIVELIKGDYGLGFSILDYQDPLNQQETVIVIRSLVPGGVAQTDGRLIPGDRLVAVNDINVERAPLDRVVQILKGAPKGPVKITVAKPVTHLDAVSHTSQFVRKTLQEWSAELAYLIVDTEDDQTCLEDFQECIEEYQECLEVVHISIDEENSFNHSPSISQVEDFGLKENNSQKNLANNDFLDIDCLDADQTINVIESDIELSLKSAEDKDIVSSNIEETNQKISVIKRNIIKDSTLHKPDSLTQSDKASNVTHSSDKDGYETCIDESLSDDSKALKNIQPLEVSENPLVDVDFKLDEAKMDFIDFDEKTPTNSIENINKKVILQPSSCPPIINTTVSEPCLTREQNTINQIYLDTRHSQDELKCYDHKPSLLESDEFFLVQFPSQPCREVIKSYSEPNVLDDSIAFKDKSKSIPSTYKRCLFEYYNDYEDCLEAYQVDSEGKNPITLVKEEMSDEEIFNEVLLPFKSRSAPDIMDSSFVMITYDPGPDLDKIRRKSDIIFGYEQDQSEPAAQMTVLKPLNNEALQQASSHIDTMLQKHWGSTRTVEVHREPNTSLGLSIVGGKVDLQTSVNSNISETVLGIFVKNVVANSPAGRCGQLKTGDRILKVSGIDLQEASHEKAVQAIRNAKSPVKFVVQSLRTWSTENENHRNFNGDESCPSPHPSPTSTSTSVHTKSSDKERTEINSDATIYQIGTMPSTSCDQISLPIEASDATTIQERPLSNEPISLTSDEEDDDDDEEDMRELEGRTVTAKNQQIDRASAGNVKRTKEEVAADPEEEDDFGYTTNKVKKKYAYLGHSVLTVQLERASGGLGLSLAGHKDRNCMAVFVCGINPAGAAFKAGQIQIGDEILEVNGVVLHGRCHLNASAIIKGLSGPIFKVIILRRKTALNDIAVKPITQFPVSLAEEASEESFSASYPNVRTIAIKKGTQSLGIMIIEGKHAEVGQGIFISDIQEGSAAEKAGLEIGEMILAVNKDSLVGSNYDNAAALLKRTEGLVTLVVSNPGKKDQASPVDGKTSGGLKTSAPPSRSPTPVPEPPVDPATCPIAPGKETTIEVLTDNKNLGVFFVGGKDTLIPNGIVVVEVYAGGMADKDGRLQPGDQILDVNGTSLKDVSSTAASQALHQTLPKMKLIVYRPENIEYTTLDVDLVKKAAKGLGLSIVVRKSGKGVYIGDTINGGAADVDGKIMRGDLLVSINGQKVDQSLGEDVGIILKTVSGKVSLKFHRYKSSTR